MTDPNERLFCCTVFRSLFGGEELHLVSGDVKSDYCDLCKLFAPFCKEIRVVAVLIQKNLGVSAVMNDISNTIASVHIFLILDPLKVLVGFAIHVGSFALIGIVAQRRLRSRAVFRTPILDVEDRYECYCLNGVLCPTYWTVWVPE